jgi:glycosyltransferase involved in cell wall biosynthesis
MVLVSAVIPTCGRPQLLRLAVLSVLAQTLREIEVVVVIDGDDPASLVTVQELAHADGRVRVLPLSVRVGGSDARNQGVNVARGEWIAFLDDDDEWLPGKLQAQLDAVKPLRGSIVLGTCKLIARTPRRDYVWPRRMPDRNEQIGEYLLARRTLTRGEGYIQTSTFFVARALMQAQPFKSGLLKHQDTEWILRLARLPGARIVFVDEALTIHNIEEDRITVSNQANWRYSLGWAQRDRHLFTPRALSGFVLHQVASEASDQGAWCAFFPLLRESLRHGRSLPRDYAIFLAMWLLPRCRRRRLRDRLARQPRLRLQAESL